MRAHSISLLIIFLTVAFSGSTLAESQAKDEHVNPNQVVNQWKRIGLAVEIPWRKSNFPSDDYTYISQARSHVGSTGSSGFKTEVEAEILGHTSSKPHQISVGIEVWNPQSEMIGRNLAVKAISAIGVDVPNEVMKSFKSGKKYVKGDWEVANESTDKIKEIRVYYRQKK